MFWVIQTTHKQTKPTKTHHFFLWYCLALSMRKLLLELNGMNQHGPQAQRIPVSISKQRRQACRQLNHLQKESQGTHQPPPQLTTVFSNSISSAQLILNNQTQPDISLWSDGGFLNVILHFSTKPSFNSLVSKNSRVRETCSFQQDVGSFAVCFFAALPAKRT